MNFIMIWILNPLKPVAGSQWHWGLRCLASIFGIRLIIFVFGDFCVGICIRGGLLWPFVVFCDLSVFLHDGLWCTVPLLWTLPYFVVFVTIIAFMVVQLGCSAFGCFGRNMIFWLGRSGFHGCFDDFSLDLNFGLIIFVFRCIWQPWKVPCQICR